MGRRQRLYGLPAGLILTLLLVAACRPQNEAPAAGNVADDAVKISVTSDGFYRVTLQELQEAGLDVDALTADNLHLSQAETAVPLSVMEDAIIFYGQAPQSRYVSERPYILQTGTAATTIPTTAIEMGDAPDHTSVRQTLHLEEDQIYKAEAREDEQSDVWFWHEVRQQEALPIEFAIPTLDAGPATLRMHLWGFTHNPDVAPDHEFEVQVNDQSIGTVQWDGPVYHTAELEIPDGVLRAGSNHIVIDNQPQGASFLDIFLVNWIELGYRAPATAVDGQLAFTAEEDARYQISGFETAPLLFDVSNSAAPRQLTGWDFDAGTVVLTAAESDRLAAVSPDGFAQPAAMTPLRSSTWRTSNNQADLLIITTDELAPAIQPLVEAREAEGLSVAVVPVAEIYDAFGGEASPESIRAFVKYAVENWQPPTPRYVFLVGDATTDYRGNLGELPTNNVPSLLVPVAFSGETASDSRLVDIDDDLRPDLAVGRWPVRTPAEVASLVERTLAYEAAGATPRALFAADGTESHFAALAGQIAQAGGLPAEQVEVLEGPQASEVAQAWNAGSWLATYVGHGSLNRWGKEDVFDIEAVSQLEAGTPPIVLQLTCLTGLFSHPQELSLSEAMLVHPQGPVLLVAATSLTLSSHQEPFAIVLIQQLQAPEHTRVGDAFQAAKLALEIKQNSGLREISDTFALFGDPSARIVRP